MVTAARKLLLCGPVKRTTVTNAKEIKIRGLRHQVNIFMESDDNSTMAPGKSDPITRNEMEWKYYLGSILLWGL